MVGVLFVLAGKEIGQLFVIGDYGSLGFSTEFGIGGEVGRVDFNGESGNFEADMLNGDRHKVWVSVNPSGGVVPLSVGISYVWASIRVNTKSFHLGVTSFKFSFSQSVFGAFGGGWNFGRTKVLNRLN